VEWTTAESCCAIACARRTAARAAVQCQMATHTCVRNSFPQESVPPAGGGVAQTQRADSPGPNGSTRIISNAIDVEHLLRPASANDPVFSALDTARPLNMANCNRRADHCPKSPGLIDAPEYFTSGRPSGPRPSLPSCSTLSSAIIYLTFPPSSFCRSCQPSNPQGFSDTLCAASP
jgi:hypothetical protein